MDALTATALTVAGTVVADRYLFAPPAAAGRNVVDPSSPGGDNTHPGYLAALAKARETWGSARSLVEAWGFEVRDGKAAHGLAPGSDVAPYWPVEESLRVERRWRGILTAALFPWGGGGTGGPTTPEGERELLILQDEVDNVISFHELTAAAGIPQWESVSLDCYRVCRKVMLTIDITQAPAESTEEQHSFGYYYAEQLGRVLGAVGGAVGSAAGSIGLGLARGIAGIATSPAGAALLLVGAYALYRRSVA